ncbi:MAG: choice-of-anchor L domain-containing protein, partial [Bacteroidia bacterium]|nr:choice-of-anchor L domain-containing protein [Bacteroidia bacterium]
MIKNIFKAGLILCTAFTAKAQLTVNSAMTPTQLVQNVLLGSGVTASNITFSGPNTARGEFNGTASNIGFPGGVILATGNITNAIGPNNDGGFGNYTDFSLPGDPDLDQIMNPTDSYDAIILEFDFIPTSDTVKFKYVFGSEEYMEYVSTTPGGINDGFGFFISGPGITGPFSNNSKNIAIIPGTSLPVTMFNLNLNNNGQFYFDNENPPGASVQYDGFTVPLTAMTNVQCGSTYHIKIAIADGGDGIIDSGVFLEAGSFSSVGVQIIPEDSYGGANDSTLYEGCGNLCIHFVRTSNITVQDTINLTIGGTAVNGTDYYDSNIGPGALLPSQLIFAPGQDSISFCINAVSDAVAESLESITLLIQPTGSAFCVPPPTSTTIYLSEYTPIVVITSDTTLCNSGGTV